MKYPILRTKLKRSPVAPDIWPRERLLNLLDEGRNRTLTLISAPAGYGKSTLASRWVAASDVPTGWVSLDGNDSDLRTFLSYVLASVRSLFPEVEFPHGRRSARGVSVVHPIGVGTRTPGRSDRGSFAPQRRGMGSRRASTCANGHPFTSVRFVEQVGWVSRMPLLA